MIDLSEESLEANFQSSEKVELYSISEERLKMKSNNLV